MTPAAEPLERLTLRLKAARTREEKNRLWEELFPKLHQLARGRIHAVGQSTRERPTDLVLDLYPALERALANPQTPFESSGRFFAYAATAMRHKLARGARRRLADELVDDQFAVESASPALLIALDQMLERLAVTMPRAVRAFELRTYGGYSREEIVQLMSSDYRKVSVVSSDLTLVRKALEAALLDE